MYTKLIKWYHTLSVSLKRTKRVKNGIAINVDNTINRRVDFIRKFDVLFNVRLPSTQHSHTDFRMRNN